MAATALDDLVERAPRSALDRYAKAEIRQALRQAIHRLTEREQTVLGLYYFEGMTAEQVADVLGVHESMVEHLLLITVVKLRSLLSQHFPEMVDVVALIRSVVEEPDEAERDVFLQRLEREGLLIPPSRERVPAAKFVSVSVGEDPAAWVLRDRQ